MKTIIETSPVTLSSLVKKYASYNLWANGQLVGYLKSKPEADLDTEVPSSFSSLRKTLVHIYTSEVFWLSVIQETAFEPPVEGLTIPQLMDGLIDTSAAIVNFVSRLSEAEIQQEVYFTSPWAEATRGRFDFIHHAMNHSTYHRGQLITIGRSLGYVDAPMTDYNFYLTYAY